MSEVYRPTWECVGCGHGTWDVRQPLHCIKCGGTVFRRPEAGARKLGPFWLEIAVVERTGHDVAAVRGKLFKSTLRNRARICRLLGDMEGLAAKVTRLMTELPDKSDRPGTR